MHYNEKGPLLVSCRWLGKRGSGVVRKLSVIEAFPKFLQLADLEWFAEIEQMAVSYRL